MRIVREPISFLLEFRRRHEEFRFQSVNVKIYLFELPRLLHLSFVVCRLLPVSKDREKRLAAMCDVDAFDELVVFDDGLGARLPEDVAVFLAGFYREQPRILQLDQEPRSLAEVAPYRVVDDFVLRAALRLQCRLVRVHLQYEAILVVYDLLANAHGAYK